MESVLLSIFLRTGQIAIESSSTLLVGFFVAAVMRRMLGESGTRKLFGGEGWKGLFRAWFIGSLIPVCSFGVIPVAREMRRAGVPSATILSFILAAPQLNPLSFLYGLTLSEPIVIICFVAATMVVAVAGGEVWKRFFELPIDTLSPAHEKTPPPGVKRLLAVLIATAREAVGPSMGYIAIGILFTGIMAGVLPHGILANSMKHSDWSSAGLMASICVPFYSGVLPGMMRIGLMFEHGNSVGAAYILFAIGVGMNLGLVVWLIMQFGARRILQWLACIILANLAIAYSIEIPLFYDREEASHTHAFDEWTGPSLTNSAMDYELVRTKLLEKVEVLEPLAIGSLLILGLIGGVLRKELAEKFEAWMLASPPMDEVRPPSFWNMNVPGPVLGFCALIGLVIFSIVALFIYYPPPKQAFREIVQLRADAMIAVKMGRIEEGVRLMEQWDLLTRKLQVGWFLREGELRPEASAAAAELREALEAVRDSLLAKDVKKANQGLLKIDEAFKKVKAQFPVPPDSSE